MLLLISHYYYINDAHNIFLLFEYFNIVFNRYPDLDLHYVFEYDLMG